MLEIDVKDVTSGIPVRLDKLTKDKGLGTYAATTLAKMMRLYIPERDSVLIDSYKASPWKLKYSTPYAKAMYYGVVRGTTVKFHKSTATPRWEEQVDKPSYAKQLEGYIKRML